MPQEETTMLPLLDLQPIPFPGVVAAGKPFEILEGADQIKVPRFLLSNGKNLALRVRGGNMVDAEIRDGDIVIVRKQRTAENGQTVVALVNGQATVKRFYRVGSRVELRPANPLLKSIILDEGSGTLEIRGIVIGLIRNFLA
jgi:repressor LexA